ncbi:hypothetical protein [Pseudomonas vanderleydeniana]|uniref:Uncharacterized protein n=1 Tax=Pseudomonas vanderleydeniana TaxID=2745495 RepID=A0A9E6PJ99_9PSED|nr:hypothetical protein [Pseudomonas vanderleydeniana]QXI27233.1 hypothetical protein HU752_025445 [Pseudomonas vanderleydeniana]
MSKRDKPVSGWFVNNPGPLGRAVQFSEGELDYYESYSVRVEGVFYTGLMTEAEQKKVIIPAQTFADWASRIELYGVSKGQQELVFYQEGIGVNKPGSPEWIWQPRPPHRSYVKFHTGSVSRYYIYYIQPLRGGYLRHSARVDVAQNTLADSLSGRVPNVTDAEGASVEMPSAGRVVFGSPDPNNYLTAVVFARGDTSAFEYYSASAAPEYPQMLFPGAEAIAPNIVKIGDMNGYPKTTISIYGSNTPGFGGLRLFSGKYEAEPGPDPAPSPNDYLEPVFLNANGVRIYALDSYQEEIVLFRREPLA